MSVGVIVGRFQIPELHEGHKQMIQFVSNKEDNILFVIGTIDGPPNDRYPLAFQQVRQSIIEFDTNRGRPVQMLITALVDVKCHKEWSRNLDRIITSYFPMEQVTLYGGRDSFIQYYSGKYNHQTVTLSVQDSGDAIRSECKSTPVNHSLFRRGIIYSQLNRHPVIYPTVDIAMYRKEKKQTMVLLAKKDGQVGWRFPGGFVDFADESLEAAAKRELFEETKMTCEGDLIPIGSLTVGDWRATGRTKILTTLFAVPWCFGIPKASDDIAEVKWHPLCVDPNMVTEHVPLWNMLQKWSLRK